MKGQISRPSCPRASLNWSPLPSLCKAEVGQSCSKPFNISKPLVPIASFISNNSPLALEVSQRINVINKVFRF